MTWLTLTFGSQANLVMGLLAALGSGLLIGLERERHKGQGPGREPAGLRTFTLAALTGALAQGLDITGLVAVGALAITALAAIAYARSRAPDPGLTTEVALLLTYLIGVLCIQAPLLGAPAAITLTGLLAARSGLHRFATHVLREKELHDGLLLGALALVVLPLMPAEPLPWLAGMKATSLMGLLLLLLVLQAMGHIALRMAGPQTGLALSGLMSGLVSSTATIGAMGARARAQPELLLSCAAGAVMSTAATWLQTLLMLLALAPQSALIYAPIAATAGVLATAVGWSLARRAGRDATRGEAEPRTDRGPLRLREALVIALLLSVVTMLISAAQKYFGQGGLYGAVALAGFADAHAPVASLAGLQSSGQIQGTELLTAALLAISCNSVTRSITALAAGGWRYARIVAGVLLASLVVAWLARWAVVAAFA